MRSQEKPRIDYSWLYKTCISRKKGSLKALLLHSLPMILQASKHYETQAIQFFNMLAVKPLSYFPLSRKTFEKLYTQQMADEGSPGRGTYDVIMASAKGRCLYCSHGLPWTLDHYVTKSKYAEFSIFPNNLVPCCRDCNSNKPANPIIINDQFLHPYYESVAGLEWLICRIDYSMSNAPTLSYDVDINAFNGNSILFDRVKNQFKKLRLNEMYSTQANDELTSIQKLLKPVFDAEGAVGVQNYLAEQESAATKPSHATWKAAMYKSMKTDSRFCGLTWGL